MEFHRQLLAGIIVLKIVLPIIISFGSSLQLMSPEVYWVQNASDFAFPPKYSVNSTYQLTNLEFTLKCRTAEPNGWEFRIGDKDTEEKSDITISKYRISKTFVSELKVILRDEEYFFTQINFSCYYVSAREEDYVTCLVLERKETTGVNPFTVKIREHILKRDCHSYLKNACPTTCNTSLAVDMNKSRGTCGNQNHSIATKPCKDIDSCKSLMQVPLTYCNGSVKELSRKSSLKISILPKQLNIIYCVLTTDYFQWTASLIPYPSFGTKSWTSFNYFETIDAALDSNSIIMYARNPNEIFTTTEIREIQNILYRDEFALGETVEFVCIGVEYLYMKGFLIEVNGSQCNDSCKDQKILYELNSGRHITRANVTMDPNIHKANLSRVSCRGPVWNSYEWKTVEMRFILTDPAKPRASLVKEEAKVRDKTLFKFTCLYEGWPQPSVVWQISDRPSNLKNLNDALCNTSDKNNDKKWCEIKYARISGPYIVNCTVTNLLGSHTDSIEIKGQGSSQVPDIVLTTGFIIICVFLASAVAFVYWRNKRALDALSQSVYLTKNEQKEFYHGAQSASGDHFNRIPFHKTKYELERSSIFIEESSLLGTGMHGVVCRGHIRASSDGRRRLSAAVKFCRLAERESTSMALKGLLSEVKILSYLGYHENIVSLLGTWTENLQKAKVYAFLELCELGSLHSYLKQCKVDDNMLKQTRAVIEPGDGFPKCESKLEKPYANTTSYSNISVSADFARWSYEIANGMAHLASRKVVHADLATRNVLLTRHKTAKLCDFGLSRRLYDYSMYSKKQQEPLPWRWMSPEALKFLQFTEKSDVWAFGVTLWEIYNFGAVPYPGLSWDINFSTKLVAGLRPDVPKDCEPLISSLMSRCWNSQAAYRPTFSETKEILKHSLEMPIT